jgi:hypothetical protein
MGLNRKHGITTTTYTHMAIDSGAVYVDYGEGGEALLGATRGGNSFAIEQEIKQMEVDGARGPVKGGARIVNVVAKITANFVELDHTLLSYMLVGSTLTDNTTYQTLNRALDIEDTDYFTNVAIVGELAGNDSQAIVCYVKNPIATGNFEAGFNDKDEMVIPVEFTGSFTPADLDTEPWEIDWPVVS